VADDELTSLHLQRAVAGDAGSQAFVVERFTPVLLAQARHRLQGRLAAVCEPIDVVQEVWSIALPRLGDLQPRDGRYTPVLLRFLATTVLRRVNWLVRKHLTAGRPLAGEAGDVQALPDDVTGAITRAHCADVAQKLEAALAELPDDEREVVVLRGIEQLSNRAVARQLGVEDFVVTRRYQRALRRLQDALPGSVFWDLEP
jgi:RNA polymerase sigma-70 factor (ECF subfamily)